MRCSEVRRQLDEHERGVLEVAKQAQVGEHLAGCRFCASELARLRALTRALGVAPDRSPSRDLWPAIRSQLTPRHRRRAVRRWPALVGAGATLASLALVATALWHDPVAPTSGAGVAYPPSTVEIVAQWDQPMADDASLALSLLLQDTEGNGEAL